MNASDSLFIAPALDAIKNVKARQIPQSKKALAEEFKKPESLRKIREKLHLSYIAQNISYWLTQDKVYDCKLSESDIFEPYFVAHRDIPLYDEVFNGCFQDKLSHVNSLRELGYKMKMLPDVYIVHLHHRNLKKYVNWCRNYTIGKRLEMRKYSTYVISRELRGFLKNTHYPSLFYNGSITEPPLPPRFFEQNFSEMVARGKKVVRLLKRALILLLLSFGLSLFFLVKETRR